jgi:chromosome segregation protein
MYLKRIEIKGFKSFADEVHFPLSSGVTAFVGPNGCGKSNIVDSIRWAFGGRARSIRGTKMEDVLFTGNPTKAQAEHAYVSMIFSNKDRQLPLDEEEVEIRREMFSDTLSKYSINGTPCKASEMKRLFEDTGLGNNSYSIIEQGKIGQILTANSEERRALFEEAAGITGSLIRIRETKHELENALQQLEIANVETERLKKDQKKLEEQAKKAQQWSEFKKELRNKQLLLGRVKLKLFREKKQEALEKITQAQEQHQEIQAQLAQIQESLKETENRVAETRQVFNQKDRQSIEWGFELDQLEQVLQMTYQRMDEWNESIAQKREQNILLKQQIQVEQSEIQTMEADSTHYESELEKAERTLEEKAALFEEVQDRYQQQTQHLDEQRQERMECERKNADLRNQLTALETQAKHVAFQLQRTKEQSSEKEPQREQSEKKYQALQQTLIRLEEEKKEGTLLLETLKQEVLQLQQTFQEHREKQQQSKERLYKIQSQWEVLKKLEEAHEGYQAGSLVLKEQQPLGFQGLLLDHLRPKPSLPPEILKVLDSFLQDSLQFALFENEESLFQALNLLKEKGRATCVNLEKLEELLSPAPLPAHAKVIGSVADLLEYTYDSLRSLFEEVLLVEDRASALQLLPHWQGILLTQSGEVFHAACITGGGEKNSGIGLLSRKVEIANLAQELALEKHQQEILAQKVTALQLHLENQQSELEKKRQLFQEREQTLRDTQKDREVLAQEFQRLTQECKQLQGEQQQLRLSLNGLEEQQETLEEKRDILEEKIESSELEVQQLEFELKTTQKERELVQNDLNQYQIQLAQIREKYHNRESLFKHRLQSLGDKKNRLDHNDKDILQFEERIHYSVGVIAESREKIQQRTQERQELQESLKSIQAQLLQIEKEYQEKQHAKNTILGELQKWEEFQHHAELQKQEQHIKLEELLKRFAEEEDIPLEELEAPLKLSEENPTAVAVPTVVVIPDLELDFQALEQEIHQLKKKMGRIGNINLDSLAELENINASLSHQLSQQEDCLEAKNHIEEILQQLEDDSRRRF